MKRTQVPVPNPFFLIAAGVSALLLVLAFPNSNISLLAWVGLVPIQVAIVGTKPKYAFLLSLLFGALFFSSVFWWMFSVPGYTPWHHAILGFYLGLYFGIYGLLINAISSRLGVSLAFLISPFVWVTLEYMRSNFLFLALPWALLAHSQYQNWVVIQIASLTGAYGVSFLIALVNGAISLILVAPISKWKRVGGLKKTAPSVRGRIFVPVAAAVLLSFVLLYGHRALSDVTDGKCIRASVLQGNIDQERKRDHRKHAAFIMQRYTELTKKAALDRPELIVWPEAATPGFILNYMSLTKQLTSLIKDAGTHFLIGSSEFSKFQRETAGPVRIGNEALFLSPEGEMLGQYLKIHLVPFGEYIPLEGTIRWPDFIIPEGKEYHEIPGKEYTLFNLKEAKFGVVICWEHVFPELFRTFVKNGADFMLNITNEGWFGDTAAPHQMLAISVFRSVENRRAIARAANTGISCFIDPYGRITGRVRNNQKDTFVEGYLTGEIPLSSRKTFYTGHGDILAYLCIAVTVIMAAFSLVRARDRS